MPLFLLLFFGIFGGINLYVYVKLCHLVTGLAGRIALGAVMLLLVGGALLVRLCEQVELLTLAKAVACVAYPWMAIVVWLAFACFIGDVWNLGMRGLGLAWLPAKSAIIPAKPMMWAILALVALVSGWSVWEAQNIRVTELEYAAPQLPPGSKPIRIAVISDQHVGVSVGWTRLRRTIELVREAQPDLVLSLGDLLDATSGHADQQADALATVQAPLGKYAILGNHEFYVGVDNSLEFNRRSGFVTLRRDIATPTPGLRLVGVDDVGGHHDRAWPPPEFVEQAIDGHQDFILVMNHRPDLLAEPGRFDLQLSGHTHGGQFFPFLMITAAQFKHWRGGYDLGSGSHIYVSRGAGTWGPPMRLFAPPEILLVALVPPAK